MTDLERRIKAKIPGEDTGIEVKRSLCAICSPGHHCGVPAPRLGADNDSINREFGL